MLVLHSTVRQSHWGVWWEMYLLVLVFPLLGRDPLLHLTKLVLHLCVQVEEPGPQGPRLLGVLQVQGGRHDPQRLEHAGLDILSSANELST